MKIANLFLICLLCCPPSINAQPLAFQWTDFQGRIQAITLDIPSARLREGMLLEKDQIGLGQVQATAFNTALTLTRGASTSDVRFGVTGTPESFDIAVEAPQGLLASAQAKRKDLLLQVEQSIGSASSGSYFIFDSESGGIRPDYQAIANDNMDIFRVTAEAFLTRFGAEDPVELINQLLAFLQSITFDDMLDSPFPMSPPIPMLVERRGDCEGKQTFLVGVLSQIFSDRGLFLINLPDKQHIIAGIQLDSQLQSTVDHEGKTVVLMDATGPEPYLFGLIPPQFKNNDRWVWHDFQH
jgi:hypothetical protein